MFRAVLHRPRGGEWDTIHGPTMETVREADRWLTRNLRVGIDGGNLEEFVLGIGWVVHTGEDIEEEAAV